MLVLEAAEDLDYPLSWLRALSHPLSTKLPWWLLYHRLLHPLACDCSRWPVKRDLVSDTLVQLPQRAALSSSDVVVLEESALLLVFLP